MVFVGWDGRPRALPYIFRSPSTRRPFNFKVINHLSLLRERKIQSMGPPATGQWIHFQSITEDVDWLRVRLRCDVLNWLPVPCLQKYTNPSALQLRALSFLRSQSDVRHVALLRPPREAICTFTIIYSLH